MKKTSLALKQEPVMEKVNTKQAEKKLHIQKVQPNKTTKIVADPGGCRPTGN